jgi:DNA recombination protein RmuC
MNEMTLIIIACTFAIAAVVLVAVVLRKRKSGEDQSFGMLQQQLTAIQDQMRQTMEASSQQWQTTHATVGQRLDGVASTVGDRLDNAARAMGQLDTRMVKVEEATKRVMEVGQDIASLQQILRAPKLRGNLGEQFLGDLLSQMLPQDAYEQQYGFKNGERVDAVIKTAHGMVSVDSKFPLENFQRMAAAQTDDERRPHRKQFAADVKKHIDVIATKYIRPGEGTFDFALMYIPAENVYYEIIARDEAAGEGMPLAAYAMKKRVVPVSPNTFYAYLNTILLGLKGMRVEKYVKDIIKDLTRLRGDFGRLQNDFTKLGKHLADASSSYEKVDKRITRFDDHLQTMDRTSTDELPESEETPRLPSAE